MTQTDVFSKHTHKAMGYFSTRELNKLTGMTPRSLQYYDNLGLLNKVERNSNGARLFTKKDIKRILEILALKFLGFNLATIKQILDKNTPIHEQIIKKKNNVIVEIERLNLVKSIIENIDEVSKTAPLELVIKLIQINKAAIYLKNKDARKLFPDHLTEKTKDYEKLIEFILLQINKLSHDELSKICDDCLGKISSKMPEILNF
jgi:DNA-binding transcriptional MerR regulator